MQVLINVKTEYVHNQIENLTREYSPWIVEYKNVGANWSFTFFDESDKKRTKKVSAYHLQRGLAALSREAAFRLGNIMTGDSDAIDADCFIQCVIFNKLVYS